MRREVLAFAVIRSSLVDGSSLAAKLELVPDEYWTDGEPVHPDHPEGPVHTNSGLRFHSKLPANTPPEDHAAQLMALFRPARDRLETLRSSLAKEPEGESRNWERLSIEIWLVCTTPDTWMPFDFPAELLSEVAIIGAQLTIEVYACADDWGEAMSASRSKG